MDDVMYDIGDILIVVCKKESLDLQEIGLLFVYRLLGCWYSIFCCSHFSTSLSHRNWYIVHDTFSYWLQNKEEDKLSKWKRVVLR